jgi:pyruvate dehydrogenase E2 component (dihydrolipoyllysine-residue acetyltransferase)
VAFEFRLPDIGEGLTEAEVVEWFVQEGQDVVLDQPLVQIETDKAVTDIPSPRAGVVVRHGAPPGTVVRVGEVLAVIAETGEGEVDPAEAAPIVGTLPTLEEKSRNETRNETSVAGRPAAPAAEALPLVRRLARELGLDISSIRGTGPGGRVTKDDVEGAARAASSRTPGSGEERVRLSKLRRTIAERMARSWREIPHVTTFGEADAARLLALRKELGVPLEALLVRSVLPALRTHPEFNASLEGEDLVLKRRYDIGFAVDTPEGLMVAVLRSADRMTTADMAMEIARLTEAVRSRTASAAELSGQTFTVSNIGAVGGGYGTPIIAYGTTAILSFGRARQQPVVREERIEAAIILPLSLSYDHRVIDGALGRRFLDQVIGQLERPAP